MSTSRSTALGARWVEAVRTVEEWAVRANVDGNEVFPSKNFVERCEIR